MSKITADTLNMIVEIFFNLQTTLGGQSFIDVRPVPHESEPPDEARVLCSVPSPCASSWPTHYLLHPVRPAATVTSTVSSICSSGRWFSYSLELQFKFIKFFNYLTHLCLIFLIRLDSPRQVFYLFSYSLWKFLSGLLDKSALIMELLLNSYKTDIFNVSIFKNTYNSRLCYQNYDILCNKCIMVM